MAEDYVLQTKITADSTQFDATLKKTGKSLTAFSSEITKVTKLVGGLFAITSLTALAKSISDVSKEFSKATSNIAKGTGATGKALDDLAKSVNKAMLNGVGRSASEVGSMVADLNTRFDATGETLERMVDSFDAFADVTDTDVKTSINTVADIMAKWNISIDDSDKLLDQLTVASQMSGASVTELSTSLAKGQSILSQFGMSLTESTALFASLKKNGVDTSVALAGMRTALANFSKDGKNAKNAFEEVSEKIKNAKTQTEALQIATETFGIRSGAEMLKVLQSSAEGAGNFAEALRKAGGALEETDRASRTSKDALDDLKATIQATFFTGGGDTKLRDMIDGIAEAIRSFDFSAIKETFSTVGLYIKGMWSQFKVLFNNLSGSIDIATGNFEVFADMIYQYLDNAYRSMQNFVNMIDAIMKGDWSVAWEYAKLIALRTIKNLEDSINNAIRLMPNLFNSVIEGYNWVLEQQDKLFLEVFHLPEKYFKSAKLPKFEGEDLIDTASIENAIEDVRKTIEEKTGKSADYSLKQLAKVEKQTKKTTKSIEADIGDLGLSAISQTDKMDSAFDGFLKAWSKQYEDLAGNWTKTFVDMANIATSAMGEMFETIGQGLVDNGIGYEDFASIAIEALSEVLKALAAQLSALAAVNATTWNYGKAAAAAAGAAAALVAAGTLKAVASSMKKSADSAKKMSDELKTSVESLEEFKKRLENIWSGSEVSFGLGKSVKATSDEIKSLESDMASYQKNVKEYSKKTQEAYSVVQEAEKEWNKANYNVPNMANWHYKELKKIEDEAFKKFKKTVAIWNQFESEYQTQVLNLEETQKKLALAYETLNESLTSTNDAFVEEIQNLSDMKLEYETLYGSINGFTSAFVRNEEIVSKYASIVKNEQFAKTRSLLTEVYEEFANYGLNIGETLMSNIVNGASKSDFLSEMKDYIRNQMLKLTIYTEAFTDQIADIGIKLISAMTQETSVDMIDGIKNELSDLFDEAEEKALKVESVLTEVFGEITDSVEETTEAIEEAVETLTSFESMAESFFESISDLGGDIANQIIDGLSEGLSEADFMQNMYNWVKKLIVQTVVYTESMKSEIEQIGRTISEGLSKGFSETSLHELRRDLSYIFYSANQQMSGIDSILSSVFDGYATGTDSALKGLHIVGESGPELIDFKGGERVYNNADTMKMLSGSGEKGNTFNVTFNNLQDTSAYTMMSQLRDYNRQMAINGIL